MSNKVISNSNPDGLSKEFLNEHHSNEDAGFMVVCEAALTMYLATSNKSHLRQLNHFLLTKVI